MFPFLLIDKYFNYLNNVLPDIIHSWINEFSKFELASTVKMPIIISQGFSPVSQERLYNFRLFCNGKLFITIGFSHLILFHKEHLVYGF